MMTCEPSFRSHARGPVINCISCKAGKTHGDTVFVLHCSQKKSQRTATSDINLGKRRYKQMKELTQGRETP